MDHPAVSRELCWLVGLDPRFASLAVRQLAGLTVAQFNLRSGFWPRRRGVAGHFDPRNWRAANLRGDPLGLLIGPERPPVVAPPARPIDSLSNRGLMVNLANLSHRLALVTKNGQLKSADRIERMNG